MEWWQIIELGGLMLGAFLLGGILFSLHLGRISAGKDLRNVGDHNPGAWNLIFNVNKWVGILGALLDAGKGVLAYYLGFWFFGVGLVPYLTAVSAVAGHNWSPFHGWRGGKGVATTIGALFAANILTLPVFSALVVALLFFTHRMILGILGGVAGALAFLVAVQQELNVVIFAILLLAVLTPKYIMESRALKEQQEGDDRRPPLDLFTAKPR